MIEMGLIVAIGLIVIFAKLGWRARLWMLSHPILMDIVIFAALTALHWGTFSGVMVATIGALTCSLVLGAGRWVFGYMQSGKYVPGRIPVKGI